jgi:hypothetical protein
MVVSAQEMKYSTHVLDNNFNGPAGIFIADIDGDSLKDVIAAGADGHTVSWWKNMGGYPLQWSRQDIDNTFTSAIYVYPGDVDGDGHTDVAAAGWNGNELAWWRNDGNDSITWTKYVIRPGYAQAHEIMCVDIDIDGDTDIIGVSAGLNRISVFENDGHWPINWTEHILDNNFDGARSVDVNDIDGDGDLDIAGAALDDHEIAWWRNDSEESIGFTKITIGTGFTYAHKVQIVDMDKDGDEDILGTAFSRGLAWWENDGEDSTGWTKRFISNFSSAVIGWAIDADLDDDLDIVCSAQTASGKIGLWYNDGVFPFTWDFNMLENDLAESWPLHYGDLDNDGDIDLVSGGNSADEIRMYENVLITNLNTIHSELNSQQKINCYPVPFKDEVTIEIELEKDQEVTIKIFDLMGHLIEVITNKHLSKGTHSFVWRCTDNQNKTMDKSLLFIQLQTDSGRETIKVLKRR